MKSRDNIFKTIGLAYLTLVIVFVGMSFLMLPAIISVWTGNPKWMFLFFFTVPTLSAIMAHKFPIGR